jgi:cytochrome c
VTRRLLILAVGLSVTGAVQAQDPQALLQKYKCNSCHAVDESKTGPAFVDVAAKYRGDSKALAKLVATIRGGAHDSGPWHMPPHPEVSAAEARSIARYILALKR